MFICEVDIYSSYLISQDLRLGPICQTGIITDLFPRVSVTIKCSNTWGALGHVFLLHSIRLFIHSVFSESLLYTQHKGSGMSLGLQENHALQWDTSQVPHTHCIPNPAHHDLPGVSCTLPAFAISAYGTDLLELRHCPWPLPLPAATSNPSLSPVFPAPLASVPPHPTPHLALSAPSDAPSHQACHT